MTEGLGRSLGAWIAIGIGIALAIAWSVFRRGNA
jgi:hypothetical protein